jgi:hypothetical protein
MRSHLWPTAVVSAAFAAFFFIALLGDPRSTYGNASFIGHHLPFIDLDGRKLAILLTALALLPLPILIHHAITLIESIQDSKRTYQSDQAILHPISLFLLLFEATFHPQPRLRLSRFLTRLLLVHLLLLILLTMWLGLPNLKTA